MELISIIMPMKNAEPFIRDCLDSIINQSITDWKLIIVDDHSSDQSASICLEYAKRDARIHLIPNKDKGILAALQLASSSVKGKYITRMDADDIMPPQKLEKLVELLKNSPHHSISTGLVKYFAEEELANGFLNYEKWINEALCSKNPYDYLFKECFIPSPCWMMHSDMFHELGGFETSIYPEDYDFCYRCYENNVKIVSSDEVLHLWRDHSSRASRNLEQYKHQSFIDLKLRYLQKWNADERPYLLWGAGPKGKEIAKKMIAEEIDFEWCTNNKRKIGHDIYGKILQNVEEAILQCPSNFKAILAVSQPGKTMPRIEALKQRNALPNKDYFRFH